MNKDNIQQQLLGVTDQHICYLSDKNQSSTYQVGIHQQMVDAYQALVNKGEKAGLTIQIASGFRPFERQLQIWNNKFFGRTSIKNENGQTVQIEQLTDKDIVNAILLYSALPGTSRHHWGTDIDIFAPNLLSKQKLQLEPWEYLNNGPMAKLSEFLHAEAHQLGFYFPYDSYRQGVAVEPWHLSYAPLANIYQDAFNVSSLKEHLKIMDIGGKIVILDNIDEIVQQFVLNVNPNPLL